MDKRSTTVILLVTIVVLSLFRSGRLQRLTNAVFGR